MVFTSLNSYTHMNEDEQEPIPWIRELLKGRSEQDILEAEENWRGYMAIVKRIAERIAREKEERDKKEAQL